MSRWQALVLLAASGCSHEFRSDVFAEQPGGGSDVIEADAGMGGESALGGSGQVTTAGAAGMDTGGGAAAGTGSGGAPIAGAGGMPARGGTGGTVTAGGTVGSSGAGGELDSGACVAPELTVAMMPTTFSWGPGTYQQGDLCISCSGGATCGTCDVTWGDVYQDDDGTWLVAVNWSDCDRVYWDTGTCGAEQPSCASGVPSLGGWYRGNLVLSDGSWKFESVERGLTGSTHITGLCGPAGTLHDFAEEVYDGLETTLEAVSFGCAP